MIAIMYRIVLWLLPRLIDKAIDVVVMALRMVATAELASDKEKRREYVCRAIDDATGGVLPSVVVSVIVEVLVALYRLGVTAEKLDEVDKLLEGISITELLCEGKRMEMIEKLGLIFPDLPGRITRLLYDFAVLRIRGG